MSRHDIALTFPSFALPVGELKKENQRLHEEVEHLSGALMDAQLSRDVSKRRMQRTDSQSDCDDDDDEDSDDSETSTHNAKPSSSQLTAQVHKLENLVASLQATNNQLAIRIEHLDDEGFYLLTLLSLSYEYIYLISYPLNTL